ncbi:ectoine/hydroxyectoine ABC transporter permease subunit EhuD [Paenibacillus sp. 1011MAR3C5]|uniref:ectoine/hydroxyectoine ABC transporter permease subunit EhuD n=1 Tax=Paenibacillus sp. 1011MAR3C5 TaxID=1675787 RepID=UPI000E6C656A|nr:ectoine/hydroxyectoine ABC transporter permease subunit EhuD [Paenibacillus sp. 1011MAR3C5]RJE90241.1 ectoine/hydroxyectoine ABC transporter permease subunit EhuD [Paenibacillus sp. 1011MAR3C5]
MWNWDYALEVSVVLLRALPAALLAAGCGFLIASTVGLLIATLIRSRFTAVKRMASGVAHFIRSTPLLVQLFFLYYSLPMLVPVSMTAFWTGAIGLGLHYSTYMSEVYRSGIDALPKGQWEAATALNLSKRRTWFSVILPQSIPPVLPIMGNYLIVIFKETPTLSAITYIELLLRAKNEASISYRVFEPYTIVGIIFIAGSLLMSFLVTRLEHRWRRHTSA